MIVNDLGTPWPRTLSERFTQVDDELICVVDDGRVLIVPLAALDWHFALEDVGEVNAVSFA